MLLMETDIQSRREDNAWLPDEGQPLIAREQWAAQTQGSHAFSPQQPLVRLAIAEPLLYDIVNRDLIGYLRAHRKARVDLVPMDNPFNPQVEGVHICVWLSWPESAVPHIMNHSNFEVKSLGTLEYVPCVAKRYVRGAADASNLAMLEDFMLVQLQDYATVPSLAPWNRAVAQRQAGVTTLRSYGTMRELIRWGASMGLIPYYAARLDKNLLALPKLLPNTMKVQAWLAVNRDVSSCPDVSAIVDVILGAFDERRAFF